MKNAAAIEINGRHVVAQFTDGQRELWFTLPKGYEQFAVHVLDSGELTRRAVTKAIGDAVVRAMNKRRNKENMYCTALEEARIVEFVHENFEVIQFNQYYRRR